MGEVRRVIAPGGRVLAVDLGTPIPGQRTIHSHAPAGAGSSSGGARFDLDRIGMLFDHLGMPVAERGPIAFTFRNLEPLRYLLAGVSAA